MNTNTLERTEPADAGSIGLAANAAVQRLIASLIRVSGSFDRSEEAMQEAFASALASWPEKGVPANPGAWITVTAHRKLIDGVRREQTWREKQGSLLCETKTAGSPSEPDFEEAACLSRTTACA